jgi:hypothetical protein
MRTRPEKIGCGVAGVLLGSTGLGFLAGSVIPGMTGIAWVLLLGSNLILWIGLLAVIQGHKEDIHNRLDQQDASQRSLRERLDELRSVSLEMAATHGVAREPVPDEQAGRLLRDDAITDKGGGSRSEA